MKPTPFLKFWKTVNDLLTARGCPELTYGEAKTCWDEYQGWGA